MSRDLTISPAAYAAFGYPRAGVAELADAPALGAGAGNGLGVRVPPPAFASVHPFGPTNESSSATLARCATEMLRGAGGGDASVGHRSRGAGCRTSRRRARS